LLQAQEGAPMASMDLRTRENDGRVLVALRGELDIADAASAAAALVAVAARAAEIIVDLAAWSSSTPAAWRRWSSRGCRPGAPGVTCWTPVS
jgi:hypothetical protein